MVVEGKSSLHEGELRVGHRSLLLEPEIHIVNVIIEVDFCWSLLITMVVMVVC